LGLPAAELKLAEYEDADRDLRGTLSKSFVPANATLVHGNELLTEVDPDYDEQQWYGQSEHRVDRIFDVLEMRDVRAPLGSTYDDASEVMAGYLVLDGWIANVDRHHENWGILQFPDFDRLAPTYDHASSLGRLLSDAKRLRILEGRDRLTVEKFVTRSKANGAVRTRSGGEVPPYEVVRELVALGRREPTEMWNERLVDISDDELRAVFERFPSGWISEPEVDFSLTLLARTRRLIAKCLEER